MPQPHHWPRCSGLIFLVALVAMSGSPNASMSADEVHALFSVQLYQPLQSVG